MYMSNLDFSFVISIYLIYLDNHTVENFSMYVIKMQNYMIKKLGKYSIAKRSSKEFRPPGL